MNYILFDPEKERKNLLPFTFTRPVSEIRVGILTITEKWEKYLGAKPSFKTEDYLQKKYPFVSAESNLLINGSICPNVTLAEEIKNLKAGEALYKNGELLVAHVKESEINSFNRSSFQSKESNSENHIHIKHSYDIFSSNAQAIEQDFDLITKSRKSAPIPAGNQVLNPERIFIEEGASVLFSILNASTGSIYIGKDAEVMEGSKIRGPFALCEHAGLKMDAKIYGATTVGPYCKVGGEVNNSVFFAYSNKGHDGFVGNAVIGEWCNLGADTNNSNLKNTYEEVKLWNYTSERFDKTGLTFCGLMMADHAKSGINTMFNTGTVVGVGSNIFGSGFPRNFVPDFSWGGASGFETFQLNKMFQVAEAMCKRRNVEFTETDKEIILHVFEQTRKFRFWEKPNNA